MKYEPGPELDALVAEKVMGWELINPLDGPAFYNEPILEPHKWHCSTNITDAMEVVAELIKWVGDDPIRRHQLTVAFGEVGGVADDGSVRGLWSVLDFLNILTPPNICIAALLTKENK